jgi:hypothetical protein
MRAQKLGSSLGVMLAVFKKVGKHYKYYLTEFGRQWAAMALKLRKIVIIPNLALPATSQA